VIIDPTSPIAYVNRAESLKNKNNLKEALISFDKAPFPSFILPVNFANSLELFSSCDCFSKRTRHKPFEVIIPLNGAKIIYQSFSSIITASRVGLLPTINIGGQTMFRMLCSV
jgi:hypothetical protein